MPVATGSGTDGVKYYDVELHFTVGADGNLHADAAKMTLSPVLADDTHHFLPGDYVKVNGPEALTVTGPVTGPDGREIWSWTTSSFTGTWMSGPAAGNTLLQSLPKDAIFPKGYCYGLDNLGRVIAVQQLGDKILIAMPGPSNFNPSQYVIGGSILYQRKPPAPSN